MALISCSVSSASSSATASCTLQAVARLSDGESEVHRRPVAHWVFSFPATDSTVALPYRELRTTHPTPRGISPHTHLALRPDAALAPIQVNSRLARKPLATTGR